MLVSPLNFNPAVFFDKNVSSQIRIFCEHKKCLQSYCGHSTFHYSCPENSLQKRQLFAKNKRFLKRIQFTLAKWQTKLFRFCSTKTLFLQLKPSKTDRFSLLFRNKTSFLLKRVCFSCKTREKRVFLLLKKFNFSCKNGNLVVNFTRHEKLNVFVVNFT